MLDPPEACIENCTSMWPLPLDRTVVVLFAGLPIIAPTSDQTSGGSIMLPVQRQVPTAFPKAAVSAGSGLGAGGPALFLATLGPFFFAGALSAFGGGLPERTYASQKCEGTVSIIGRRCGSWPRRTSGG